MAKRENGNGNGNGKRLATQQSVDQAVKSICDIMRRGNCAGAMQYVPELTWILFLRILDEKEQREEQEAEALGVPLQPLAGVALPLARLGRAAGDACRKAQTNKRAGTSECAAKRLLQLRQHGTAAAPEGTQGPARRHAPPEGHQRDHDRRRARPDRHRAQLPRRAGQGASSSRPRPWTTTHVFTLSQVYEGLLLKMGEKGNDGGQFFTPRQVIKAMVQVIDPKLGRDGLRPRLRHRRLPGPELSSTWPDRTSDKMPPAEQLETLKQRTFWGREKENLIYPIALANLVLHGIDKPNLWHGNTLTGQETYGGLFEDAPQTFDVILTNPPFGGKEGKEAQTNFDYKTGATQVLFLQHVIRSLREGGRCGIVLDEGVLFRTNETPSSRPSASCSTIATCGAWSACPAGCSRRRARA